VSERTRRELGERLGIDGQTSELLEQAFEEAGRQGGRVAGRRPHHLEEAFESVQRRGASTARHLADLTGLKPSPRLLEIARRMQAHYLGSVADLDRDFGGFVEILRTAGTLEAGYLVFTSDHGEAFGEHGALFHSGWPFEEQTRIPLLIAGRSISPRSVDHAVTLVDLAPTLADMAGLAQPPEWPGRSLLSSSPGRPVLSFQATGKPGEALSLLERERKVLCLLEDGDVAGSGVIGAFDLALDAREERDLSPAEESWPRALLAKHAAVLALALVPVVQGEAAELDDQAEAELRALGY
jgi:hypothetical protein